MNFIYKFDKLLVIREREKEAAALTYEKAVQKFQEVAEKLYMLLKKKETMEEERNDKIQSGLSIQDIRLHQQYISNLQKEIDFYQQAVIRARQNMQYEEQKLIDKNIEVKKFEKLKEKEYRKHLDLANQEEEKMMNEIAMQTVIRGN